VARAGGWRRPKPTQRPKEIDRDHQHGDRQMRPSPAGKFLVGVQSMRLEPRSPRATRLSSVTVASTRKTPLRIAQTSMAWRCAGSPRADHGERKSEKSAAGIAHENARRRPVPYEKTRCRGGQHSITPVKPRHRRISIEQRPRAGTKHGLAPGIAVYAIHEIEEVGRPGHHTTPSRPPPMPHGVLSFAGMAPKSRSTLITA